MSISIEAIYERGVFRPLKPLSIDENRRFNLVLTDVSDAETEEAAPEQLHPPLVPTEYPDDYPEFSDADYEYQPVPPTIVGTVKATCRYDGPWTPPQYPDEQD